MHRLSSVVLPAVVLFAALSSQPAALGETLSERIDVVEVQLEVQVVGRDGEPVSDLSTGDFRVEIGGEPAEVLAANEIGGPAPERSARQPRDAGASSPARREAAASREADAPRDFDDSMTLVLFLDEQNISPLTAGRMLGQIFTYLDRELRPGDRVMLASYDRGLSIRLPLTGDLDAVRKTLRDMVLGISGRMAIRPERRIIDLMYSSYYEAGMPCEQLETIPLGHAREELRRTLDTIAGLGRFVETLAGVPGRKAVLHVSDGIPLVAGAGPLEYLLELCTAAGLARGVHGSPNLSGFSGGSMTFAALDMEQFDTSDGWYRLAAGANRHNVTFYPLKASGLRDPTRVGADTKARTLSPSAAVAAAWNQQDPLVMVAVETGGSAILNTNEVSDELDDMVRDLRRYYLLSVRPPTVAADRVERVQVRVERPGVEVRHRKSLRFQSLGARVAHRTLAAALHDTTDNSMGLTTSLPEASPRTRTDGKLRKVRLRLHIPLDGLTALPAASGQPAQGRVTVFVAATDAEGGTTPVRRSTLSVPLPSGNAETPMDDEPSDYVFEVELQMRPGEHVVGFGVLDEIGGGTSYLRAIVDS